MLETNCKEITTNTIVNYLDVMFTKQFELQQRLNNLPNMSSKQDSTEFIRKNILYTIDELSEMCRELKHYKHWKNYDDFNEGVRASKAEEEYIDAFHFFMNIGIGLGMDAHKIFEVYLDKNKENHARQDRGYAFTDSIAPSYDEHAIKQARYDAIHSWCDAEPDEESVEEWNRRR